MRISVRAIEQKFGNWINPILVKELRQGMRSKFYTIVLLGVQVVMLFYLIFGMAMSQGSGRNSEMEALFWVIVSLIMLLVLPLMGTNALSSESRESRLDLLVLTRLSARRIVYGKWFAIVAQGALLVASLLPYLVLRYYIGSVEFHESLLFALCLLAASAIITGVAVCLSVIRSAIVRWIIIVMGGFWLLPLTLNAAFMGFLTVNDIIRQIPWYLGSGILLVMLAMEFAASRICPVRENHDTPKRIILWTMFLLAAIGLYLDEDMIVPFVIAIGSFFVVAWDGICRPVSDSPPVYDAFVRLGIFGRVAGRLFYPGWLPAIAFSLVTLGIFIGVVWQLDGLLPPKAFILLFLVVGAYLVPFAVILYTPMVRQRYGRLMLLFQLCLGLLMILLYLIDENTKLHTTLAASWSPTSVLFLEMLDEGIIGDYDAHPYRSVFLIASAITTALALLAILIKAIPQSRTVTAMERKAISNRRVRKQQAKVPLPPVLEAYK